MSDPERRQAEGCTVSLGHDGVLSLREDLVTAEVVVVDFDRDKQEALAAAADARHEAMKDNNLSYGLNTRHSQFVGVLGEGAVLVWLYETMPAHFEFAGDQPGGADAYVRNPWDGRGWTLVEVKTHDAGFWRRNGRLVNALQLSRMAADILVWCVVPPPIGRRVVIVGWSPVAEVQATGVAEETGTRQNVRVHAPLRTPRQLADWLRSGRPPLPDPGQ